MTESLHSLKHRARRLRRWWGRQQRRARRLARWARKASTRRAAVVLTGVLVALAISRSCSAPPRNPEDLCSIFQEKRSWYSATRRSFEEWGISEPIQLAIIYQESSFRRQVRPLRRRILWIFPGPRPSTAYGYGQVLESTWASYQRSTGRGRARRDRFADVAHFVGWYGETIHRRTGIARDDAYGLYLAYHEGSGGYARGTYRGKAWLIRTARRVASRAERYQQQYDSCRQRLERWWIFW